MSTAQSRADAQDRLSIDLLPVCPTCDDFGQEGAKWCQKCGTWFGLIGPTSALMRERAIDVPVSRDIESLARMTRQAESTLPLSSEAASPAKGMGS